MKTRTGLYPIGFRRMRSDWQQDIEAVIRWAKAYDLSVIDLEREEPETIERVIEAGLAVGTVDLLDWHGMISPEEERRLQAVEDNAFYIEACAAAGATVFFVVMLPEDPARPRLDNFGYMVDSFTRLAPVLEQYGALLAVEGWPGPGALCCTPEGYRAFFGACPSPALGISYDPANLIRQGIDPIRFLQEFDTRILHVHGKDVELYPENLYEYGMEVPPTFTQPFRFGRLHWRSTIPGQGEMRWATAFRLLANTDYAGTVCIELEDENFSGTMEGEQMGILQGAWFLTGC